jgi:predicted nuclease of predicted toxin-antitoxin system
VKILLDENLPHRLRPLITGHDVFTVAFMKWSGVENGELLTLAASQGFEAVITMDSGMPYEQNLKALPCSIVVLQAPSNELEDIKPLLPALLDSLQKLQPQCLVRVKS